MPRLSRGRQPLLIVIISMTSGDPSFVGDPNKNLMRNKNVPKLSLFLNVYLNVIIQVFTLLSLQCKIHFMVT